LGASTDDDLSRLARALGVALDDERREKVAEEQLRMVLSHTRSGTVVATLFAVVLAYHLSGTAGPLQGGVAGWVAAWVAAKVLVALARVVLAHLRQRKVAPEVKPTWRRLIYGSLALDGLVWGVAGFALMGQAEPVASLVAAVVACVSCVATFGLQVRTAATAAYSAPMLVPTAIGLALRGDDFGLVGGVGLLMLLGLQVVTARGAQKRLAATVLLQINAQALAAEKDAALLLAQRQSAVKSQFVAKVSHELRTPLHGILGLARLLHVEAKDAAVLRRVELIESSGTHLLGLINDLLDVSRIEAGHFAVRQDRFDLAAQFEQITDVFAVRAADKGLNLRRISTLPRPYWVTGDPARLRQVLNNLLGNAVKFTRQGGITVTLEPAMQPGMLQFEVADSGVGIPPEELARIFQPFQQSDLGRGQPAEGAGLGLTIAREIAQGMGGDISVSSQPGVGSTFVFTAVLPPASPPAAVLAPPGPAPGLAQPTARPAPSAPRPATVAPPPDADLVLPRQVLVAEDDEVNALIVLAYLDGLGVRAERVINGKEAVGRALRETDRPELVLMDCRMPVMDGMAATREIRLQEQTLGLPRIPIVALTATSAETDRQTCLDSGMDDFVSKPFTRDELARTMAHWCAVKASAATPAPLPAGDPSAPAPARATPSL
jgi:signal transduction histidine kinase